MASIVQDIQSVRSLRKDLRDSTLPVNINNLIENIHTCIKGGTDLDGWKKVDWRTTGQGRSAAASDTKQSFYHGRSNTSSNHSSNHSSSHSSSHAGDGYRDFGINGHNYSSSHTAFSHRFKSSGFASRPSTHHESQVSIPLSTTKQTSSPQPTPTEHYRGGSSLTNKYVSKFKKNSDKVEDTILNTIILGKLNKFSEKNYDEIKEFITHIIDSGETDMIKCFMKLVFEKAASEEIFCPLYAKLLGQLSARYPILLTEMANLYSQYMEIFEEVSEDAAANYNEVCKRNVEKKYRRGYSQFLAELIKHDVIDIDVFMKTVTKIITQVELNKKQKDSMKLNEEYADCLMKIMTAIEYEEEIDRSIDGGSDDETFDKIQQIRTMLKTDIMERIAPLTIRNAENLGISNKTRFTFLGIYESIEKF